MYAAKRLRKRCFETGHAINQSTDYYVEWGDLGDLLTEITDHAHWLLITGPLQSGKSSLMYALAEAAERKGYHPIVTTLTAEMIRAANNRSMSEEEAEDAFFEMVANSLSGQSRASKGAEGLRELFREPRDREIIWFLDDASLLNDIRIERAGILQTFLSELRALKQGRGVGGYYLRSFVLVGTPQLKQLIGDFRIERLTNDNVISSPFHDPLGNSIWPLSLERSRETDAISVKDIAQMLMEFSLEHDAEFRLHDDPPAPDCDIDDPAIHAAAILKFSKSIWGLTGGHRGMVCICCVHLANRSIFEYDRWKRQIRLGHVSRFVLYSRVYSRVASKVVSYPEPARRVILECIRTGGEVSVGDLHPLLAPLNDGVLKEVGERRVAITSKLLLAAFLEDRSLFPPEVLPRLDTFLEAVRTGSITNGKFSIKLQ